MPRNAKPRGTPLPDKVLVKIGPMAFLKNSPVGRLRLGKNTRPSDIGIGGRGRPTHTNPVKHTVDAHIDTTGARDPSRMRHAKTKATRIHGEG